MATEKKRAATRRRRGAAAPQDTRTSRQGARRTAGAGELEKALSDYLRAHLEGRELTKGHAAKLARTLWKHNLDGVGFGAKETAGNVLPDKAVRVYARSKLPRAQLDERSLVPESLLGDAYYTDVVQVGALQPLHPAPRDTRRQDTRRQDTRRQETAVISTWLAKDLATLRAAHRDPLMAGVSVGPQIPDGDMAGTLGYFLHDDNGAIYILSNNHVLAASRLKGPAAASFPDLVDNGDDVFQPGTLDRSDAYVARLLAHGAAEDARVATLTDAVPLHAVLDPATQQAQPNRADVAIAAIETGVAPVTQDSGLFTLQQGQLAEPPAQHDPMWVTVAKVGRTTGSTIGTVVDVNANIWVPMRESADKTAHAFFVGQIGVVPLGWYPDFSAPGDSGSIVYDVRVGLPIGLLFAGGDGMAFVNPWSAVIGELQDPTRPNLRLWT